MPKLFTYLVVLAAVSAPCLAADHDVQWSDTPVARLEAYSLLASLNQDLLTHDSATLTLERWCASHHMALSATVVAILDRSINKEPSPTRRIDLSVGPDEPVRYRRVSLSCGGHVLSEADNWYVPSRLTPEMNHVLDTSDTAFGRAVQNLHFKRQTLSSMLLWQPLPDNWENGSVWPKSKIGVMSIPHAVIQHRAILKLPNGTPFSEVVETYTSAVLDFTIARLP